MFLDERLEKNDASGNTVIGLIQDIFSDIVCEIDYIQWCINEGIYSNDEIYNKLEELKKKLW